MAGGSELAVTPRTVEQTVPCFTVITDDGKTLRVPTTAEDNRLLSQIHVSKLRELMNQQLDIMLLENKKQKPDVIKDVISAWDKVENMGRFAYAPGLLPNEGGEKRAALDTAKAVAEGMTTAMIESQERRNKIAQLGKTKQVSEAKDGWET